MKSHETVQVTTRLPKNLVKKIEHLAKSNARSRNKIVQMACEEFVEHHYAPEGNIPKAELDHLGVADTQGKYIISENYSQYMSDNEREMLLKNAKDVEELKKEIEEVKEILLSMQKE